MKYNRFAIEVIYWMSMHAIFIFDILQTLSAITWLRVNKIFMESKRRSIYIPPPKFRAESNLTGNLPC